MRSVALVVVALLAACTPEPPAEPEAPKPIETRPQTETTIEDTDLPDPSG
ncbi:MAG: hypothetical protein AAGE83_01415 [Pseudomonadota bacterium]